MHVHNENAHAQCDKLDVRLPHQQASSFIHRLITICIEVTMNPSHAPFYVNFNLLFATNNIIKYNRKRTQAGKNPVLTGNRTLVVNTTSWRFNSCANGAYRCFLVVNSTY